MAAARTLVTKTRRRNGSGYFPVHSFKTDKDMRIFMWVWLFPRVLFQNRIGNRNFPVGSFIISLCVHSKLTKRYEFSCACSKKPSKKLDKHMEIAVSSSARS